MRSTKQTIYANYPHSDAHAQKIQLQALGIQAKNQTNRGNQIVIVMHAPKPIIYMQTILIVTRLYKSPITGMGHTSQK